MKTAAMILALAVISSTCHAAAPAWQNKCEHIQKFAETIMDSRQLNVSMSKMMDTMNSSAPVQRLAQAIVIAAYKQPRYDTKEMQQSAVRDFGNDAYLECVEASTK